MKNPLPIIGVAIVFIAIIGIFLYSFTNTPGHFEEQKNDEITNSANLNCIVIDKNTKTPIENAIVYLGTGFWNCSTDNEGKCSIKVFPWGDYGLGVFKKGYNRYTESVHFTKGDNSLSIELEKKSEIPQSIFIKGKIIEIVTAEGSKSENHYFKIKADSGEEYYIFNEIGQNWWDYDNWKEFINKSVRITGFIETGYIGWQHEEAEGIYVELIELVN
jgi:hypothetical protein